MFETPSKLYDVFIMIERDIGHGAKVNTKLHMDANGPDEEQASKLAVDLLRYTLGGDITRGLVISVIKTELKRD